MEIELKHTEIQQKISLLTEAQERNQQLQNQFEHSQVLCIANSHATGPQKLKKKC